MRRGYEADELGAFRARSLELVQRVHRAAAGGEHRVEHIHASIGEAAREPLVVVDRYVLLLVPVDADVADPGVREQAQEALDHAKAGAQHRHDRHLVAQPEARRVLERGFDVHLLQGKLPRDLNCHDRGGFEQGLAEVAVGRVAVAHHGEAIGQDRVLDDCQVAFHGRDAIRAILSRAVMADLNVELKARDPDPEATAARCLNFGAVAAGTLRQTDTYFHARSGRLKLRTHDGDGASELIAYQRQDQLEPTGSSYIRVPVPDRDLMIDALNVALGQVVVVFKRRRLFLWEGVRIHLDEVEGLGNFIEFEAAVPYDGDLASAQEKVAQLRAALGIENSGLVSGSYADLLLGGAQALLRAADSAMRSAYAPYSQFKVGAAVRAPSGAIYAGANVENVAYPQGQCAEASALGALVTAGESAITAVAVVAERVEFCPPCGGCRQRLAEFGDASIPVYLGRPGSDPRTVSLGELLPGSFGREELDS